MELVPGQILLGGESFDRCSCHARLRQLERRKIVYAAMPGGRKAPARGGVLAIRRSSGRRAYEILIAPLAGPARLPEAQTATAAMFISDPEENRPTDPEILSKFYGF